MSRRRIAVALVALAVSSLTAFSDDGGKPRSIYPTEFPPGAGKELADRWCQMCHSPTLVTQQAKDSTGWEKTLGQMEKWGVVLGPEERDTLRIYLMERFGPRAR